MDTTDILIAGGGIAGLTAAARLGVEGWQVVLVDPAPAGAPVADLRTTAFFQPAIATLSRAYAWAGMQAGAAPLRLMRIVDAGGREREPRDVVDFEGHEAGHAVFGWNVANRVARAVLAKRLAAMNTVRQIQGASVEGYVPRRDHAIVRLSDGDQIKARLVVAADGRDSTLRGLAGIKHRRWEYGQSALVFAVTHDAPHDGISTEIHRTGGPLTLVPMPDLDGQACSSVVWMMPGPRARDLGTLDDTALGVALTSETMGLFGPLRIVGPRAAWPILSQVAPSLRAPRLALIAEAAHVMPPIGAQGLNTSLHDIETLASLTGGKDDPGAPGLLAAYERAALPRTLTRVAGIDLLNRAAQAEAQPLRDLRRAGLRAISRIGPLRQLAIRAGLGR